MAIDDSRKTVGMLKVELLEECRIQNVKIENLPTEGGKTCTRVPSSADAPFFILKMDRYNDFLLWDDSLLLQHRYVLDDLLQTNTCHLELIHVSPKDHEILRNYRHSTDSFNAIKTSLLVCEEDLRVRSLANATVDTTRKGNGGVLTINLGDGHFSGEIAARIIKATKKDNLQYNVSLLYNGKILSNSANGEPLITSVACKSETQMKRHRFQTMKSSRRKMGSRSRFMSETDFSQLDFGRSRRRIGVSSSMTSVALNRTLDAASFGDDASDVLAPNLHTPWTHKQRQSQPILP